MRRAIRSSEYLKDALQPEAAEIIWHVWNIESRDLGGSDT